ncbi:MAG TPA: hypothetical protein VLL75_17760 [Vicinamibacteria bacterium]|nr:hypothetical protein [Vicinamibacteria bacterium]
MGRFLPRARIAAVQMLLVVAVASGPATAGAQVFLATRANPEFEIGPLFVRASVGPSLGPVTVDVLWSLAVPPTRSALGLEQDLYLLWPAELRSEEKAAGDPALGEYVRSRGFTVTGEGRLPVFVEDLYPPPGATAADRRSGAAPFVSFRHVGLEALGVHQAASMIRIPWTPDLVNRVRLLKLRLRLDGAIRPKPANWLEELVRGPRHVLSLSFNDVREPALFPLYLENRARALQLASEPSQLLVRFADAKRLRIDDIFPRTGTREPADGAAPGGEMVSVFLDTSEGAVPQVLTIQFGYASGLQAWAPILIPLVFFVLGRATGPLIERAARGLGRSLSARVRFGGGAKAAGRAEGAFLSRETLARIAPGRTTYEEVLALCGRDTLEEQERLGAPERRTLVYRGRRVVPRRERRLLWLLSSVSDWELEEQEVEIALEHGVVQDVQVGVRRARLSYPEKL